MCVPTLCVRVKYLTSSGCELIQISKKEELTAKDMDLTHGLELKLWTMEEWKSFNLEFNEFLVCNITWIAATCINIKYCTLQRNGSNSGTNK